MSPATAKLWMRPGVLSLDADAMRGTITARPFKWAGSKLIANVETKEHGELRAEVLDQAGTVIATSEPVTGNPPRGEFRWSQVLPGSLLGQQVSLRPLLTVPSLFAGEGWLERDSPSLHRRNRRLRRTRIGSHSAPPMQIPSSHLRRLSFRIS